DDAGYSREEPGAGNPPARICEGEAEWHSYSTTIDNGAHGGSVPPLPWHIREKIYVADGDDKSVQTSLIDKAKSGCPRSASCGTLPP
ncbi:hypothetical protein, partial [Rhizobium sp. PP-CC-3G-465]|uniref:hypothetical protein n=1 Tax=Rhizobium sp. PP-CC-3G-465 TaxID=2135648 RepID=UPI001A9EFF35